MLFNHNARAFCRDCKQTVIPVHREVKVGYQVNVTAETKRFIETGDSVIRTRCPLCGSYKLNVRDEVSDEEMSLVSHNAIVARADYILEQCLPLVIKKPAMSIHFDLEEL